MAQTILGALQFQNLIRGARSRYSMHGARFMMWIDWCSKWNGNSITNSTARPMPLADRNVYDWFQMRNDIGHDPTISKWDCLFLFIQCATINDWLHQVPVLLPIDLPNVRNTYEFIFLSQRTSLPHTLHLRAYTHTLTKLIKNLWRPFDTYEPMSEHQPHMLCNHHFDWP